MKENAAQITVGAKDVAKKSWDKNVDLHGFGYSNLFNRCINL